LKILKDDEDAKRTSQASAKQTRVFAGKYGQKASLGSDYHEGELIISQGKIQFKPAPKHGFGMGTKGFYKAGPDGSTTLACSQVDQAVLEQDYVHGIFCNPQKAGVCRFYAASAADAATAFEAIRAACNLSSASSSSVETNKDSGTATPAETLLAAKHKHSFGLVKECDGFLHISSSGIWYKGETSASGKPHSFKIPCDGKQSLKVNEHSVDLYDESGNKQTFFVTDPSAAAMAINKACGR
jgi:hypothetical protein